MPEFDLNRPAMMKTHPDGSWIGMYLDDPGIFYASNGQTVNDAEAEKAGYDVKSERLEAEKRIKIAEAKAKIEREYFAAQRDIESNLDARSEEPIESDADIGLVRIERGSPRGDGRNSKNRRYSVVDASTGDMLLKDVTRADAEKFAQDTNARGFVRIPVEEEAALPG